jgi:hypothetical protein
MNEAEIVAFFTTFGWPGAVERRPKLPQHGVGTAGEFKRNLGCNLGDL